jgi:ADP-ribose pyrophosphatase YjhB (NUDIX family)
MTAIAGLERPVCPACGWIAWGAFTLTVGGLLVENEKVLLIQRNEEPNRGSWTLPGGYVLVDEAPDVAAVREMREETGLQTRAIGLLAAWHTPGPDHANTYLIFGLELTGSREDLLRNGEGVEIQQARFFSQAELHALQPIGPLSCWVATHYLPSEALLQRQTDDPELQARLLNPLTVMYGPPGRAA